MSKTYSVPTPVDSKTLSRIFKEMRDDGVSEVLELGIADCSGGEISSDFRVVFMPVDGSRTHGEIRREVAKTQCASDWVVAIRKVHEIQEKSGLRELLKPLMRSLSFVN